MARAPTDFLQPAVIQRIERLELRARYIVEGFLSGRHRSPYFGESIEFLQHRQYAPGDDLRHVDWKVWAKHDRYYVKQYEEYTNMRCVLLVDASASMQYGTGPLNKYEYAATVAASLAYLLLRQQDAVGCVSFDQTLQTVVPLRSKRSHLNGILGALAEREPRAKTDLWRILNEVADRYPRRGMMVLVSDLLADPQAILRGLKRLRAGGHDVLVLHVMDDDELDFPFSGPVRFEALEGTERLSCNPRALRADYLDALDRHLDDIRTGCASHAVQYALLRTSQPLDAALVQFLMRYRRHKVGARPGPAG